MIFLVVYHHDKLLVGVNGVDADTQVKGVFPAGGANRGVVNDGKMLERSWSRWIVRKSDSIRKEGM